MTAMNPQQQPRPEDALAYLNSYDQKGSASNGARKFSLKGKNLFVFIGLILFLIIVISIGASLLGGGSDLKDELLGLSAQQQDLDRWASSAQKNARDGAVLNTALVVTQFIATDNKSLNSYIASKYKLKEITKLTKPKLDTSVDKKLESAASNNRFDTEFKSQMTSKISAYKRKITSIRGKTDSKSLKQTLDTATTNIEAVSF